VSEEQHVAILASAVLVTVPIIWAAFGEAITEVGGVLNIGIEGVMLAGALAAAAGIQITGSLWFGLAFALPVGLCSGLLVGWLYVYRGIDQILGGIMINIFALGLTSVLYEKYFTGLGDARTFEEIQIPLLHRIPVVGPSFFDQNWMVYATGVVAVATFLLLRRTWFGLHLKAAGERPHTVESAGVDVRLLRLTAVSAGCVLVAIGGASIVLMQTGGFGVNITSGRGYIALAVVILARWNPLWIVAAGLLFGVCDAIQLQAQSLDFGSALPQEIWSMLPYVVTIVAVVVGGKGARYPASCGVPYRPGGV
jgi:simple sugar transport system permease protein